MSVYQNNHIKKEKEQDALAYFLDAYQSVTDESIRFLEATERPDFICARANGRHIGIELTKIQCGHPEKKLWYRIIKRRDHMPPDLALDMIQQAAIEKEEKRTEHDWKLRESTMLIIELIDIRLRDIKGRISNEVLPDVYSTGFEEIWLADFSDLEAYDNIELYCIRPDAWLGYYSRALQKPYG